MSEPTQPQHRHDGTTPGVVPALSTPGRARRRIVRPGAITGPRVAVAASFAVGSALVALAVNDVREDLALTAQQPSRSVTMVQLGSDTEPFEIRIADGTVTAVGPGDAIATIVDPVTRQPLDLMALRSVATTGGSMPLAVQSTKHGKPVVSPKSLMITVGEDGTVHASTMDTPPQRSVRSTKATSTPTAFRFG